MCLHLTLILESFIEYFLKYSNHVLLLSKVKTKYPYTADDGIAIRDHDTCIGYVKDI